MIIESQASHNRLTFYNLPVEYYIIMTELETNLCLLNNRVVCIVRPSFGKQSSSWVGQLSVHTNTFPITFQISLPAAAMVFTEGDVKEITNYKGINNSLTDPVIILKGPNDYYNITAI